MSRSEWIKVEFQQFINEFGNEIIINNAPIILYSKRDKEHEAYSSLIAFFFVTGGLLIYIALSYFLAAIYSNIILFSIIIAITVITDILLITNFIKSNVFIRPLECWVEVYKGTFIDNFDFYCIIYYPIFSGKCFPNKAKNVIFKLYQEEVLKSKIDITQIEVYFKSHSQNYAKYENLGYFFQYAEGRPFNDEQIDTTRWKFFRYEKSQNENFLATANWVHQYEWRDDLEFDFDKLHEYAPWIIQRWNTTNLKPLTEDYKKKINWSLRNIEPKPKLNPWQGDLETQTYESPKGHWENAIIKEATMKIIGNDIEIEKIRDIKEHLSLFKAYFRDFTL